MAGPGGDGGPGYAQGRPVQVVCPLYGTLTEVSGPTLAPTREFSYDGSTYTIMSINPGADSFTVFRDGYLFVNKGAAITDGIGFMAACDR